MIAWWLPWATGCQSIPRPAAGTATLRVVVVAEPKPGSPAAVEHVSVYDSSGYGSSPGDSARTPREAGAFELVNYYDLDEIVIWLEPADAPPSTRPAAAATAAVTPALIEVDPRQSAAAVSSVASVGQRLVFHNRGPRPVVVYSVSDHNNFDLGTLPAGGRAEWTVSGAGLIEVLTNASADPVAKIYAAPTRWVSLARSGRNVDFTDVPPGRYRLVSWHPRLPGYEKDLTLRPDQTAFATIKVGVNALPKAGAR